MIENMADIASENRNHESAIDIGRLCQVVCASVDSRGFAYVDRVLSLDEYRIVAEALGVVKRWSDVELRNDLDRAVYKPHPMPFHTDDPDVRYIGWQCITQDAHDGASQLVDSRAIFASFSNDELDELAKVIVHYPCRDAEGLGEAALLEHSPEGPRVYYAPWLLVLPENPDRAKLARRFADAVESAIRNARIDIRMNPGEALFIDNRRMLHGRAAIAHDSKRLLRRVWITETGASQAVPTR